LHGVIEPFQPPVDDEEDFDIYDALGLNAPVGNESSAANQAQFDDPLAAFMDEDDEEDHRVADLFQANDQAAALGTSPQAVEALLATLARDLMDEERLVSSLAGGAADLMSLKVERDREAYHLSLIVDMGGHSIKPFATVVANNDTWMSRSPPKGLNAKWKPLYEALCAALSDALKAQGRPSTL